MKKFIFIALFTFIFLATGCLDNYIPIEKYNNEVALYESQLEETKSKTEAKSKEILELKREVNTLENDLDLSKEETEKYQNLIANLNDLLKNVYYMECTNAIGGIGDGTAFAIEYNQNIYVISSGHIVENENGIFSNFRIRTNDEWIYLELLEYRVTNTVPDYSIFYSDKINNGLEYDINNSEPDYRLGINKLIQENNNWGIDGECGSPIINLDGEVIGIHAGYLQDIDLVLKAIDKLE